MLFGALGTRAHWAQLLALAGGAGAVDRPLTAAVVAMQLGRELVQGHARIAAPALGHPAAVVTHQRRGEAAPVDEHQHLVALAQVLAHQLDERAGHAALQRATADIQTLEAGWLRIAGPLRQAQQLVATALDIVQTLEGGCGRAEDHADLLQMPAVDRQVPGVVAQAVLLLVGQVVFFINDDQAGPGQGCEYGRAGTDDDARLAVAGGDPGVQTLAVIEARVQDHHRHIEAASEALHGLRRQADLRDQDQCLALALQAVFDRLQVDFRLATAGHPLQQPALKALGGDDAVQRSLLFVVGLQRRLP